MKAINDSLQSVKKAVMTMAIAALLSPVCTAVNANEQMTSRDTRIGKLEFERGYPTPQTVDKLYNEIDFQRACQAFIWGLPIVSMKNMEQSFHRDLGADDGNLISLTTFNDLSYGITANATTPYLWGFYNLAENGPLVIVEPAGKAAGFVEEMWQQPAVDLGIPGPFAGNGGKHLVLAPGQAVPESSQGYNVVHSRSNSVLILLRNLETDPSRAQEVLEGFQLYPFAKRSAPEKTKIIPAKGRVWSSNQPRGMKFWQVLADAVNSEPAAERDLFFLAMLKPLGIEKGKPFKPDARQQEILDEAAYVGETMALTTDFAPRSGLGHYADGTNWEIALVTNLDQRDEHHGHLDERAMWFYEALTTSKGMTSSRVGVGSIYLTAYKDSKGDWLDGGQNYRLRVPANVPAKNFWSVTVYHNDTRYLIQNPQQRADRSSRYDMLKNADGSIDIYFGPTAPEGKEQNWIPTNPGEGWFSYFRLYGPLEAYFDRTWVLPSIEKGTLH
jgi:hypothetical protein